LKSFDPARWNGKTVAELLRKCATAWRLPLIAPFEPLDSHRQSPSSVSAAFRRKALLDGRRQRRSKQQTALGVRQAVARLLFSSLRLPRSGMGTRKNSDNSPINVIRLNSGEFSYVDEKTPPENGGFRVGLARMRRRETALGLKLARWSPGINSAANPVPVTVKPQP
jgi:hypothetical protein